MTKALVEEILALEADSERKLEAAAAEGEQTVARAREKAHAIIQQAESGLETEREDAIKEHSAKLRKEHEDAKAAAAKEAASVLAKAKPRVAKAAGRAVDEFVRYATHDVS